MSWLLGSIIKWFQVNTYGRVPVLQDPNGDGVPAQGTDEGYVRVEIEGTAPGVAVQVEGLNADDDPATANPVMVGGRYAEDPFAAPLSTDGDIGDLLINILRMLIVEDRVYDAPTDANKNVPVWSQADRYDTSDLSDAGDTETITTYHSMDGYLRWSLRFAPVGANCTLTVHQSNSDVADPTTAVYFDVTNTFFGVASYTAADWIEPENPTSCKWLRVDVVLAGADTYTLELRKLAQA